MPFRRWKTEGKQLKGILIILWFLMQTMSYRKIFYAISTSFVMLVMMPSNVTAVPRIPITMWPCLTGPVRKSTTLFSAKPTIASASPRRLSVPACVSITSCSRKMSSSSAPLAKTVKWKPYCSDKASSLNMQQRFTSLMKKSATKTISNVSACAG